MLKYSTTYTLASVLIAIDPFQAHVKCRTAAENVFFYNHAFFAEI